MNHPALLLIGHGSRSAAGVAEYWDLAEVLRAAAPDTTMGFGFIELAEPDLDTAVDRLVATGAGSVVGVPLVLLGAGHLKNDGPACLARGRQRHPGVTFTYASELGVHPLALEVAAERVTAARTPSVGGAEVWDPTDTAVLVVGRGSSDPDANADLAKVARLLWDGRGFPEVQPAFVSLAEPSVPAGLERLRRLGARRVVVAPYFLFTGVLVERIAEQAAAWAADHPEVAVRCAPHLGVDVRLAHLVLERFEQAASGRGPSPCDCCVYRVPLPGHEAKVGLPVAAHTHADHHHDHGHAAARASEPTGR